MITKVTNSNEMREAYNENLYGLLTGKRKPLLVKEVNNTLGKMLADVKMEMQIRELVGLKQIPAWFALQIVPDEEAPKKLKAVPKKKTA